MKQRNLALVILATSISHGITAQSEASVSGVAFKDHDGSTRAVHDIPVLRTGDFTGVLNVGGEVPQELAYAWGYYYRGGLLTQPKNDNLKWLFGPERLGSQTLRTNGSAFPFRLPMGTPGYMDLPIAELTLRLWVGTAQSFHFDGKKPPTGVLASVDIPIRITSLPFALWVEDPQAQPLGGKTEAQIVTELPVAQDTYFTVKGVGTATPSTTQAMIKKGRTSSSMFTVDMAAYSGEGSIVMTRQSDNEAVESGALACGQTADEGEPVEEQSGSHPDQHLYYVLFEICLREGSGGGMANGMEACSACGDNPTAPPICNYGPEDEFTVEQNAPDCGQITLWWDCQVLRKWMQVASYGVEGSVYALNCGDGSTRTNDESSANGEITLNGPQGGITIGGSGSSEVETNQNHDGTRLCCVVGYQGMVGRYVLTCDTID